MNRLLAKPFAYLFSSTLKASKFSTATPFLKRNQMFFFATNPGDKSNIDPKGSSQTSQGGSNQGKYQGTASGTSQSSQGTSQVSSSSSQSPTQGNLQGSSSGTSRGSSGTASQGTFDQRRD
jgi:hypothetical protein